MPTPKSPASIIPPRVGNRALLKIIGEHIPLGSPAAEAMNVLWYRLVTVAEAKRARTWAEKLETVDPGDIERGQENDVFRTMMRHASKGTAVPRRWVQQRCGSLSAFRGQDGAFPATIERMLANGTITEIEPSVYALVTKP